MQIQLFVRKLEGNYELNQKKITKLGIRKL